MRSTISGMVVGMVAASWVVTAVAGCGSDAASGGRDGTRIQQKVPAAATGGATGTAANGATGAAGATGGPATTGGGPFGNPTGPAVMIGDGTTTPGEKCAEPTVAMVIDGSGSMCEPFGASTRWGELRNVLVDPNAGLVYRFQARVHFGMLLYDGTIDLDLASQSPATTMGSGCGGLGALFRNNDQCPQLVEVAPGLNNAQNIDRSFPRAELGGSTPTDKALNYQVDQLIMMQDPTRDPLMYPQFIILATDGAPNDICTGGTGGDGTAQQAAVIAATDRAAAAGIRTFVISLAAGDATLEAHLATVAQHGDPGNPAAHTYSPTTPEDLLMTMTELIGNALGCNVM